MGGLMRACRPGPDFNTPPAKSDLNWPQSESDCFQLSVRFGRSVFLASFARGTRVRESTARMRPSEPRLMSPHVAPQMRSTIALAHVASRHASNALPNSSGRI